MLRRLLSLDVSLLLGVLVPVAQQVGARSVPVYRPDPHGLDGDGDGVGCER